MKRNLYLMYAIALLQGMVFYGPVATLYRQARGVSVFELSVIESISLLVWILLEIPWGIAADRIGYRTTMILCSWLYFASKIVFWQAGGFGGFLLERLMLSVTQAGLSGVDAGILYLSCRGQGSQRAFGIYQSMSMAGLLIAAAVFSLFVRENDSLAAALTAAGYGAAALLALGLREVRPGGGERRPGAFGAVLRRTLGNREQLLFLAAAALLSEAHQTITVFLNQLQYERCGMRSAAIGAVYIFAALLGSLGALSPLVTKRAGLRGSLALFCGSAAASCLVLAATRSAALSVAGIAVLRLSNTLFQPLQTEIQNRQIRTDLRATALSVNAMLMNGVAVGTNLAFGALSQRSLPSAFCFGAGICALSLVLFGRWRRRSARSAGF